MRRPIVFAAAALIVAAGMAQGAWDMTVVGSAPGRMQGLAVGDGDANGVAEVYAASADGRVYRFAPGAAGGWAKTTVGSGSDEMLSVAVGDGNNDGVPEVFASNDNGNVYRFVWNGAAWTSQVIASPGGEVGALALGDADNDGLVELYGGADDGRAYRIAFEGGAWTTTDMGLADTFGIESIAVGDANRDGARELYAGTTTGKVVRYSFAAGAWTMTTAHTFAAEVSGLAVADADRDGQAELYAGGEDARLTKLSWTGTSWAPETVLALADEVGGLAVADMDNDGFPEVVVGSDDGRAERATWTGTAWIFEEVGAVTGGVDALAVGDGDADGLREVYVGTRLGQLVEFATCVDVAPPVTTATVFGPAIDGTWYAGPVTLLLAATDDCAVGQVLLSVDGAPFTEARGATLVFESGLHTIAYHAIDAFGRVEAVRTLEIGIDRPPVTTLSLLGTSGDNGWFLGPTVATLSATDDVSGVASTSWSLDAAPFAPYGGMLVVEGEGRALAFFSVDGRGTSEGVQSVLVPIDLAAPTVALQRPAPDTLYVDDAEVGAEGVGTIVVGKLTLRADASDSASGVAHVRFLVDGEEVCRAGAAPYACVWDATTTFPGPHNVRAVARDFAGRETVTDSVRVLVV